MIEALKSDEIVNKVGGRFKLTALIQKRMLELMDGARPLVERRDGQTDLEVVIEEILQDKIAIDYESFDGVGLAVLVDGFHVDELAIGVDGFDVPDFFIGGA